MNGNVIDMEILKNVPRLLFEAELRPVQGNRFQPTGFPDLGAAIYERPDGTRMILVESAQSMANRLEETCLDGSGPEIASDLNGIPYVRAKLKGTINVTSTSQREGTGGTNTTETPFSLETVTSSLVEAHRINSPFIITDEGFKKQFKEKTGYEKGKPINWKAVASTIFFYDPNSLLHGVFMANLEDGRIKVQRALTGFIEAEGIREAASGGVKNNPLDPTGKIRAVNYDKDVYGNVPYARMEYTADKIVAYFNFDLSLLDGYGLPPEAKKLLVALGLYKVRKFLDSGLRLRTACDFEPVSDIKVTAPKDFTIPTIEILLKIIQENIKLCVEKQLIADPPVTELNTPVKMTEKKPKEGEEPKEVETDS
jgi:CRISPR-associated protein Csb1